MYTRTVVAISFMLLTCLVPHAAGGQAKPVAFTGRVIDVQGRPVAGAKVTAYEVHFEHIAGGVFLRQGAEVTTAQDGTFAVPAGPTTEGGTFDECKIVAVKPGAALGWATWNMRENVRSDVQLGNAARFEGVIVDEAGKPVAGAEVRADLWRTVKNGAGQQNRDWLPGIPPVEELGARTDKQGRFLFSDLPADSGVDLLVQAAGKATTYTYQLSLKEPAFKAGQTDAKVVVPAEARIEGKIVDPNAGRGIVGARFAVVEAGSGLFYYRFVYTSDDQGRFSIGGLQTSRYSLHGSGLPDTLVDVKSGRTAQVTVRANKLYYGRVLFLDGSPAVVKPEPWPGAKTSIRFEDDSGGRSVGVIDDEGYFTTYLSQEELRSVQAGKAWFELLIPLDKQNSFREETLFAQNLLAASKAQAGVARIRRPGGKPISLIGKALPEFSALNVDLPQADTRDRMLLICFFDRNQRPSRHCVTALVKQADELAQRGVTVIGLQTTESDEAMLASWVKEQGIAWPVRTIKRNMEEVAHSWGIQSLPWLILTNRDHIVTAEGFAVSELDAKITATNSSASRAEDLEKAVITVTDKQGNVLTNVHVVNCETEEQYTTDAKGQFMCRLSDRMQFCYAVDKRRGLAMVGRLEAGTRQLSMELAPARVVSGRATDPNGRPVAGVQIAPLPMTSSCVFTNDEGQFDVGWLPEWEAPGGLCLMARHVGRNLAAIMDISRQAARVDIQLRPAVTLSGTVAASDGTAVAGATVSLELTKWTWTCGTPVRKAVTDHAGRFSFPALPQLQEYRLLVEADGFDIGRVPTGVIDTVKDHEGIGPIVLVKKIPTDADHELGQLSLRIVDESVKPVQATSVQIWRTAPNRVTPAEPGVVVSSRGPGLYEIESIPVGKYHSLSIDAEGFAPFRLLDVQVQKERQPVVTCRFSRGGTIRGIVTDAKGKPVADLPVAINSALCRRDVSTDPNGCFEATHLPDAHYSVVVEPPSESPYATTVLIGGATYDAKGPRIVVEQKKEVKAPRSLIGRNVWQMTELALPLQPSAAKGKAILVCLFDMEQRLSRNVLQQLSKRAKEMEERTVVTIAIQASAIDRTQLDNWVKDSGIPFPVGTIQNADDRTRDAWGVKALPWLILTDKDHVVRAEGFGIEELSKLVSEK